MPANNAPCEPHADLLKSILKSWSNAGIPRTELEFQLDVPESAVLGKSSRQLPSKELPLVDLAWFRVLDELNPLEILVQGTVMKHEVSLCDYFKLWSEVGGETILDLSLTDGDPDLAGVLLSRQFPDGQTWVTRRCGYKVWQGFFAWVITVNVACPAGSLEKNTRLMQTIAESLRPVHPIEYGFAEHLRLVTRGEPVDFASYLPISWKELPHRHDQPGPMRNVWRRELRGNSSGTFSLVVASKNDFPNRDAFLAEAVSTWTSVGIDPNQISSDPPVLLGQWQAVRGTQHVICQRDGAEMGYRLDLLLADTNSHWFHTEVFGPSPEEDFEAWAINHRALDIFARQFRHA